MNKSRLMGIFHNLLLECQEDKQINTVGINKIMAVIGENIKNE